MPKKADVPATVHSLKYQAGSSNKVYNVVICDNGVVILHWGRRGTAGQSSVTALATADDANDLGMRQVYAKKSKGYTTEWTGRIMLSADTVEQARTSAYGGGLWSEAQVRIAQGEFTGLRDAVLQHYQEFVAEASKLLNDAETDDFETLSQKFDALKEQWVSIKDQHAQVQVTMDLAEATFARRLLGI